MSELLLLTLVHLILSGKVMRSSKKSIVMILWYVSLKAKSVGAHVGADDVGATDGAGEVGEGNGAGVVGEGVGAIVGTGTGSAVGSGIGSIVGAGQGTGVGTIVVGDCVVGYCVGPAETVGHGVTVGWLVGAAPEQTLANPAPLSDVSSRPVKSSSDHEISLGKNPVPTVRL